MQGGYSRPETSDIRAGSFPETATDIEPVVRKKIRQVGKVSMVMHFLALPTYGCLARSS